MFFTSDDERLFAKAMIFSIVSIAALGAATVVSAQTSEIISLGTRPYYLVDEMKPSGLKDKLGKNLLSPDADASITLHVVIDFHLTLQFNMFCRPLYFFRNVCQYHDLL